jgi:hypothetical protein
MISHGLDLAWGRDICWRALSTWRSSVRGIRSGALAVIASLAIAACSTAHLDTRPSADADQAYAALFPYFAELCAVSELKKKPGFGAELASGLGGHAVLYLNGVCRDRRAGYPVIGLCEDDAPTEERGVGLSVNAHFKNAVWVATPGRDFLFHGTHRPGERLTRAVYAQTQAAAKVKGIYDGVEFHDGVFADKPPQMSPRDYQYEVSVATDYAIGFGRDRYCARVPLDRERMAALIAYLNELNAPYRLGEKVFDWNVLNNNCSHVAHNALAAAGIWSEWPMDRFLLLAAFSFPVPKNEFVNLARRANDMPIDDIEAIYGDRAARAALLGYGTLPTAPGALAEAEPATPQNDLYDTALHLIFYDDPIFGTYQPRFARIFAEPRYTDLEANLRHFADLYRRIDALRRPRDEMLAQRAPAERADFAEVYDRYYRHIGRASAALDAELATLARLRWAPAGVQGEEAAGVAPSATIRAPSSPGVPHGEGG